MSYFPIKKPHRYKLSKGKERRTGERTKLAVCPVGYFHP